MAGRLREPRLAALRAEAFFLAGLRADDLRADFLAAFFVDFFVDFFDDFAAAFFADFRADFFVPFPADFFDAFFADFRGCAAAVRRAGAEDPLSFRARSGAPDGAE